MALINLKKIKWQPLTISLVIVVASVTSYSMGISFFDFMESKTSDLRFYYRGPVKPGPEVVLAVVDEKSVDKEGKWVWPRSKLAQLVDKLNEYEASVVAFDIFFSEPDRNEGLAAVEKIYKQVKDEKLKSYLVKLRNPH